MRYFLITYVRRPNGKIDEQTQVTKNLRQRDWQMANVILDFKELKVLAASAQGVNVPKNWDSVHNYFLQFYESTFRRLHQENGRELLIEKDEPAAVDTTNNETQQV